MNAIVSARGLNKSYGKQKVLDQVDLEIEAGKIVGLIGPNGAGKTTALKCLLGLASCEGEINIMGIDPRKDRKALMEQVCFIADTAILPRWIRVRQVLEYTEAVHPRFNRKQAETFLSTTKIDSKQRIRELSKGMITQLHLALVMSIDAKLLVLDEPTLGLDILYRKTFYTDLLNDYFDEQRTILVTTHQVEEIETLLTDLIFIRDGKLILNTPMETISRQYAEVEVNQDRADDLRALGPISERRSLGTVVMLFENAEREKLARFGEVKTPRIADLFVAKMAQGGNR